jgi:diaminopimelate epimerase
VSLRFHKLHGAGNDFMLLDLRAGVQESPGSMPGSSEARAWGDRHRGVGFDQLLVLSDPEDRGNDAQVSIWNADGSSAEQCGNGMRAIGLYLHRTASGHPTRFAVEAPRQIHALTVQGPGSVSVDMGCPQWSPDAVPLTGLTPSDTGLYRLTLGDEDVRFGAVSLGNPHAVIEVDSVDAAPLRHVGEVLRTHAAFPEGCNVGFVEVLDEQHVRLRVLERGAGETLACGSGACAAVVHGRLRGWLSETVTVHLPGGILSVSWRGEGQPVMMTGPTAVVFEGSIKI